MNFFGGKTFCTVVFAQLVCSFNPSGILGLIAASTVTVTFKFVLYNNIYKKNVDTKVFKNRLESALGSTTCFEQLQEILIGFLHKFAPLECNYLRANRSKFMAKELS